MLFLEEIFQILWGIALINVTPRVADKGRRPQIIDKNYKFQKDNFDCHWRLKSSHMNTLITSIFCFSEVSNQLKQVILLIFNRRH